MKRKERHTYEFPRPAVTVDVALFRVTGELQRLRLQVLLIQRGSKPFSTSGRCRAASCGITRI